MKQWEVGSEFDWSNDLISPEGAKADLPSHYELFSTGCASLFGLEKILNRNRDGRLKLHLPSFFCMEAASKLSKAFDICWYRDLPDRKYPDFNTLNTTTGDLVLAVNLFGIKLGEVWQDWYTKHNDVVLIEDHTHDPFSHWALQSQADYAMASLRKTLPIPDGAMIWSGQNRPLPKASESESDGAYKRLSAMLLKRAYLNGGNVVKDTYRQLEAESQDSLSNVRNDKISAFSANVLSSLDIVRFRQRREANVRHFLDLTLTERNQDWRPLFSSWSNGTVPFNSIIVCRNREVRDSLRKYLIDNNIFPAIHWLQPHNGITSDDLEAIDLSTKIITIATDQRYSLNDVARIVAVIKEFSVSNAKNYIYANSR
ncbi:DegT/DnrJ/EryC1/StrS aminotransferase family protein [Rivularia sp. UHCC 0363]|uniref:DegT/DnrJ/EryC1/StrS aminotransferase family protein n=1 Tax=Rivularia sp. UHCC 0363 TaxID=3110244 RepID=UPI002B2214F2|nr:DegT/DnrJ/EryC1/StrS aminotransferase family protein [Rivularia sp. UHCC 0363]MEA5597648.1 DegT/DnrJ/EryC1/StrS aminotransferase family protein [Rivularia sp. UHCC 0363]